MSSHILIIEKANSFRDNLAQHLRQEGFVVFEAESVEKVLVLFGENQIELILLGLAELKRDGIAIMREIRTRFSDIKIITMNYGDQLEWSIEAMRLGAFDDFLIPFDLDTLIACMHSAIKK